MAITTTAIKDLLRPGLNAVFGDYANYPSQWSEIFETYDSKMAVEYDVEIRMTGLAQLRPEGSPTAVDTMGERVVSQYIHRYVALQLQITRQAIKDNLYQTEFPLMVKALKKSMHQTKEILGAAILNNGFNAAFPLGDGQPLYSLNHPIDAGVVANRPAAIVDLNEASLESAIISIQQFKDQAGLLVMTQPQKLVVPPQNQFAAQRILGSQFRVNTANNDINAMYSMQSIPQGFKVNQYLTSPAAWYVVTDAPEGFKHFVREKVETDMYTDFSTQNLMCLAVERYSFGVSNFRCSYASGT
jgi:phage major head subunit gpT-like protein